MNDVNTKQYYIEVCFRGLADPVTFRVGQEDISRFQGDYQNNRDSFFVCSTRDNIDIAINLRQVELVNMYIGISDHEAKAIGAGDWLAIHTRNRKPYILNMADLSKLAQLFVQLESGVTVPTEIIPLHDRNGKLVMFDPAAVLYLEAPSSSVAEGKKLMYEKERSGR